MIIVPAVARPTTARPQQQQRHQPNSEMPAAVGRLCATRRLSCTRALAAAASPAAGGGRRRHQRKRPPGRATATPPGRRGSMQQSRAINPGASATEPSPAPEVGGELTAAAAALSRFVFALCDAGAERAIKAEVMASVGQSLRPGFSRPGLITWVADSPEAAAGGLSAVRAAAAVRVAGPSIGRAESAAEVAELITKSSGDPRSHPLVFQVFSRQPDIEGSEAAASEARDQLLSLNTRFRPLSATGEAPGTWVVAVIAAPGEPWMVGLHRHTASGAHQPMSVPPPAAASGSEGAEPADSLSRVHEPSTAQGQQPPAGVDGQEARGTAEAPAGPGQCWEVSEEHHKMRISRFLSAQGVGNMEGRRALRSSRVLVNGKVLTKGSFFVKRGQSVQLLQPPREPEPLSSDQWSSRVLYEDEVMIAVDKPPGFTSTPSDNDGGRSVLSQVETWMASRDYRSTRLMPLHRLDKNTSGCLLLSKQARINAIVGAQFRSRKVQKAYFAVVRGLVDIGRHGTAEWSDLLEVKDGKASVIGLDTGLGSDGDAVGDGGTALSAKTTVQVTEVFEKAKATALELKPHTGRTHQLRVQCEARGHVIVGDEIYGPPQASSGRGSHLSASRLALHCSSLALRHPLRPAEVVRLQAPLPQDVHDLLGRLRRHGQPAGTARHRT